MNALILCAGSARRFFADDVEGTRHPKCLLSLMDGGETILDRLLRQVFARDYYAVLGTGCGHDLVASHIAARGDGERIHCIYNRDYATTNSIVTLWQLRDFVEDGTLLINGDVVVEDNAFDALDLSADVPQLLVKNLTEFDDDTYRVVFDEAARVLAMGKDLDEAPSPRCAAFTGISRVGSATEFLREIEKLLSDGTNQTWPTTAYKNLLNEKPARAVPVNGFFFDIDTPSEYSQARQTIAENA
jgi:choline kinase